MKRLHNDIGVVCVECGIVVKTRNEMSQFEKECMDGNQDCLPLMCKECLSQKLNNNNLISDVYNTTARED